MYDNSRYYNINTHIYLNCFSIEVLTYKTHRKIFGNYLIAFLYVDYNQLLLVFVLSIQRTRLMTEVCDFLPRKHIKSSKTLINTRRRTTTISYTSNVPRIFISYLLKFHVFRPCLRTVYDAIIVLSHT